MARSAAGSRMSGRLAPEDVVDVVNPGAGSRIVLVGDHAGRDIPPDLAGLGLGEAALASHIAWDIGVAGLGVALAGRLQAPFLAQRVSRLVIDCNRDPASPGSIPEVSDGVPIPGNAGLSDAARMARRRRVFDPYHARIAAELDGRAGRETVLVSLHSFTPALAGGPPRPWRFGVLHMGDSPASRSLLAALRARLGAAQVGDNEPYQMDGVDFTAPRHAIARGLDYVELEVRQDLLGAPAGQLAVADLLAPLIGAL